MPTLPKTPASPGALDFSAQHLDVQAFAQASGALAGAEPLHTMPRLLAETHPGSTAESVVWQARGALRTRSGGRDESWLHLQAQLELSLTCQRCLEPVLTHLKVAQDYRFVADEATAQSQDDESEEDVLALTSDFDLLTLLEDELLMALPFSPRHAACPGALAGLPAAGEAARVHPFAALQVLKNKL